MDDTLLASLNAALAMYRQKRDEAVMAVDTLEKTIESLFPHTPPATKREAPVRKAKVQKAFGAGKSASRIPDEQIIDAAIGQIRKGGPLSLSAITKGIKRVYPKLKGGIGKALRAEAKKTGCRVARDQSGRWIETADVKRVSDKRTPDEVAAAFAQARANGDRQAEAA